MKALLSQTELFQHIPEEEVPRALNCLGFYQKAFDTNTYDFLAPSQVFAIVVLEGFLDISLLFSSGRYVILERYQEGSSLVYRATSEVADYDFTITAFPGCKLLIINMDTVFSQRKKTCPFRTAIMENALKLLLNTTQQLYYKTAIFSENSLREKLLGYLRALCRENKSTKVLLPFGRQEFADYIGSNRSALSRELSKMQKEGIVKISGRKIQVHPKVL